MNSQCLATTSIVVFFDFTQVAFNAGAGADNNLYMPCKHLKYRYLELSVVAFCDGQHAENEFKVHTTLETLLSRIHPSRILGWSRGRK